MRELLIWMSILCVAPAFSQNVLPIGHWREHLPYRVGQWVTQSADQVYYSTGISIVSIDKATDEIDYLSTVQGLSGSRIRQIAFHDAADMLIVLYEDATIDLVGKDDIRTLRQIRNFTNFTGEKSINAIHVLDEDNILLAATYGISQLNVRTGDFVFSTFTGVDVENVVVFRQEIYISTREGVYRSPLSNPNPLDFGSWERLGTAAGFPAVYAARALAAFDDHLYVGVDDRVMRWEADTLVQVDYVEEKTLQYLRSSGQHLYAGYRCPFCEAEIRYYAADGSRGTISSFCVGSPNNLIEDQSGRVWMGDAYRGYRRVNSVSDPNCIQLQFDSPYSEEVVDVAIQNGELWLAAGGTNQQFSNRFSDHGMSRLKDGSWSIYNRIFREEFNGENRANTPQGRLDDPLDFVAVALHPDQPLVYAASFYEGLWQINTETNTITEYNVHNSSLQAAVGDDLRARVGGLVFDTDHNLWMTNHSAKGREPISVLRNDGTWQSFGQSCNDLELSEIDIDLNGFKWMISRRENAGVVVFSEGDPNDAFDDQCRVFTASNSELPTNNALTVAVDLDGDVWVGTQEGIVIFECGGSAFEENCTGTLRILQQDGFGAYLLETERVQTIAVDGANRKWVGTVNGVFLLSPSGEQQVARFTTDNSPLLDNNVYSIDIDQQTGEVFFGTARGLVSYQGDAIAGTRTNKKAPTVFPNPVRPGYTGSIVVRGLAQDAEVKITDISGKLVYETHALGGQVVWDGTDYTGRRAETGVYLVMANSRTTGFGLNKPDAVVARIVFVR